MAQNDNNQSSATDDMVFLVMMVAIGGALWWLAMTYSKEILVYWKWLRSIELMAILHFTHAKNVLDWNWTTYDDRFMRVNEFVWSYYRWSALLVLPIFLRYKSQATRMVNYYMEEYLDTIYHRFPHLKTLWRVGSKKFQFGTKFPFITYGMTGEFIDFPRIKTDTPERFYTRHKDNLDEALRAQLGPELKVVNNKIVWQDPWAKYVVMYCFHFLKEDPKDPARQYRSKAWNKRSRIHHYERTFALGMYAEACGLGVLAPQEMLELKTAIKDPAKFPNDTAYINWRSIVAFGGGVAAAEAAGIHSHYLFETALANYQEMKRAAGEETLSSSLMAQIGKRPFLIKAVEAFSELNHELTNQREKEKRA